MAVFSTKVRAPLAKEDFVPPFQATEVSVEASSCPSPSMPLPQLNYTAAEFCSSSSGSSDAVKESAVSNFDRLLAMHVGQVKIIPYTLQK